MCARGVVVVCVWVGCVEAAAEAEEEEEEVEEKRRAEAGALFGGAVSDAPAEWRRTSGDSLG